MMKIIKYSKLILFPAIFALISLVLFISFMFFDAADIKQMFNLSTPLNEIKSDQYKNQYVEYWFDGLKEHYNEKFYFYEGVRKSRYRDYLYYLDETGYIGVRIYAKDYHLLNSGEGLLLQGTITEMTKIEAMNFNWKLSRTVKNEGYVSSLYYIDTGGNKYFTFAERIGLLCIGGLGVIFAGWLLFTYLFKQDNHYTIKKYLSVHPEHKENLERFYRETFPVANIRMNKKWFMYFTLKESLLDLSENIVWIHYSYLIKTAWNIVPIGTISFLSVHTKNGRNMNIKIKSKSEYKEVEKYILSINPMIVSGFSERRYYLYMENPNHLNLYTAGQSSGDLYLPNYPYVEWNKDTKMEKKVDETLY